MKKTLQEQCDITESREYIVYKHECLLCKSTNGIYIGITCRDPDLRWCNGNGYLSKRTDGRYYQPAMANAINTYGLENFTHEILLKGLTEKEAKQKEKELVDFYDSYEHGLNCTRGGDGTAKYRTEEEAREAAILARQQYLVGVYADPEKHAKLKESQKVSHNKRKQDPEKYAKDLESCKLANQRRRADPVSREKINESARKSRAKKKSTEEGLTTIRTYAREYRREQMKDTEKKRLANERAKAARKKVDECRCSLREIYKINPEIFSSEDIHNIFDKKQGSSNYQCMTFNVLNEILLRVQGMINEVAV